MRISDAVQRRRAGGTAQPGSAMNKAATIGSNVVELFQPEGTSEPSGLGCLVIIARHHGLELSVAQLVHDNYLVDQEVSVPELLKAARSAGLRPKRFAWTGIA